MDIENLVPNISMPKLRDPSAPQRELDIHADDIPIAHDSIAKLDKSKLNTKELFEIFNDWQTKRTLTSKRVFMSTSLLVAAASWIGVDYTDLTLFGLKVTNGNPDKLIIFILVCIITSGAFYYLSRKIDASVRNAKISHISRDLKALKEPMDAICGVMERNNIPSFHVLYYDFKSSLATSSRHDAIDVFRAINFYNSNLLKAGHGLNFVTFFEQLVIYSVAAYSTIALLYSVA